MCVRDGTEKCCDPENFEPCGWCILIARCPQARKSMQKKGMIGMENARQDTHGALAVENELGKKSLEGFRYYRNTSSITVLPKPTKEVFTGNQLLKTGAL